MDKIPSSFLNSRLLHKTMHLVLLTRKVQARGPFNLLLKANMFMCFHFSFFLLSLISQTDFPIEFGMISPKTHFSKVQWEAPTSRFTNPISLLFCWLLKICLKCTHMYNKMKPSILLWMGKKCAKGHFFWYT